MSKCEVRRDQLFRRDGSPVDWLLAALAVSIRISEKGCMTRWRDRQRLESRPIPSVVAGRLPAEPSV